MCPAKELVRPAYAKALAKASEQVSQMARNNTATKYKQHLF
jgi:hypothetical protein